MASFIVERLVMRITNDTLRSVKMQPNYFTSQGNLTSPICESLFDPRGSLNLEKGLLLFSIR